MQQRAEPSGQVSAQFPRFDQASMPLMKRFAPLALGLALVPAGAGAVAPALISPGYWEATTEFLGLAHRTERYCIEPKNVAKFMLGPCNHHYRCDYPVQQVGGGKAHFEGEISNKSERYHVNGDATYTADTLDLKMSGSGHWKLVPLAGFAAIKAHRLAAECPEGAKKL
jgi:hypothetical protein